MNKELKDKLIGYFQKRHFAISYKELDEIYELIVNSAVSEERERCAKIVEQSTLITDSLLSRHKAVKELQFEIAKIIRG